MEASVVPYKDPEKQKAAMREIAKRQYQRQQESAKRLENGVSFLFDAVNCEVCISHYLEQGWSREDAEAYCREASTVEDDGQPIKQGSSVKRIMVTRDQAQGVLESPPLYEATNLQRCTALRQQIYNEDEDTARFQCEQFFQEPLVKRYMTQETPIEQRLTFDSKKVRGLMEAWDMKQQFRPQAVKDAEKHQIIRIKLERSKAVVKALDAREDAELKQKLQALDAFEEKELNECIQHYVEQGVSEEQARKDCEWELRKQREKGQNKESVDKMVARSEVLVALKKKQQQERGI